VTAVKKLILATALAALALFPIAASADGPLPNQYVTLLTTSPTACTPISSITIFLAEVRNTNTVQTATLKLFDEGANPTCAVADQIYGNVLAIGTSQIVATQLRHGLAYSLSAAAAGNILITGTGR
jgi:hypothetical protein